MRNSEDKGLQSLLIFTLRHLPVQRSDEYDGRDDKEQAGNYSFTQYLSHYLASNDDPNDEEDSPKRIKIFHSVVIWFLCYRMKK